MLLTIISLAAALAAPAFGSPLSVTDRSTASFTVDAIPVVDFVPNGLVALYDAHQRYGKPVPTGVIKALTAAHIKLGKRGITGSAATNPVSGNQAWITPVSIGTPAQVINLDFDTGSSDLWVYGTQTDATMSTGHTKYAPAKSKTAVLKAGYAWAIGYADGSSCYGTVYNDVVNIGGASFASQAVEVATNVSATFTARTGVDGLLGLAFSPINQIRPVAQKTFFENVKSSLTLPVFTVDLKHGQAGTYNFGKVNTSLYSGSIGYANVDSSRGFWSFNTTGYSVGTGATVKTPMVGAIADTGTTLSFFPTALVNAYYAAVAGSYYYASYGSWIFPCSSASTMPSFNFVVAGVTIAIPGRYINYANLDSTNTWCYGGIQDSASIGEVILGDIALKSAFVVFENTGTTPRLGFAKKTLP